MSTKANISSITVATKSLLRDAIDKRYENILVTRELADDVRTAYTLNTAGKVAISICV